MLTSIQHQAVEFTKQVLKDAVKFFKLDGFDVDSIDIVFDLKGKIAGQAVNFTYSFKPIKIRLHTEFLNTQGFDEYKNTIIHECAHLVADYKYKTNCNHNKYWVSICKFMGGSGERCHNYDLSKLTMSSFFVYKCECSTHNLSTRMHNNIQVRNKRYRCKKCLSMLVYKQ